MASRLTFLVVLIASYLNGICCRTVSVDVSAIWSTHPSRYAIELSEYMFDISPIAFWQYVDGMCLQSEKFEHEINKSIIESQTNDFVETETVLTELRNSNNHIISMALDVAKSIVSPSTVSIMQTTVGLGYYSPSVEFFATLANKFTQLNPCNNSNSESSSSFVVIYPSEDILCYNVNSYETKFDEYITNAIEITKSNDNKDKETNKNKKMAVDIADVDPNSSLWDHTYTPMALTTTPTSISLNSDIRVVLYGIIGTKSFCEMHQV